MRVSALIQVSDLNLPESDQTKSPACGLKPPMHCVRQLQKRRTHRFSTRLPGAALNGCDVAGSAKMASKKFREDHCRTDFEEVKLEVMRYYLG